MTRWMVTVARLQLLGPAPAADLGVPLDRPSPYCGEYLLQPAMTDLQLQIPQVKLPDEVHMQVLIFALHRGG